MSNPSKKIRLNINHEDLQAIEVSQDLPMIDFLHEYAGLMGTHLGCGMGICHACVVIVDNPDGTSEEIQTCITPASYFEGKKVRTIEAHAKRDEQDQVTELHPVQKAFLDNFAFQCGYCTPGFVNAGIVLYESLQKHPVARAEIETKVSEGLQRHICRCTGYVGYHKAMKELILNTPGMVS